MLSGKEITATSLCLECGAYYQDLAEIDEACPNCGVVGHWLLNMFPGSVHKTALHSSKCFNLITDEIGMTTPDTFDKLKVRRVECYDLEDDYLVMFCEEA